VKFPKCSTPPGEATTSTAVCYDDDVVENSSQNSKTLNSGIPSLLVCDKYISKSRTPTQLLQSRRQKQSPLFASGKEPIANPGITPESHLLNRRACSVPDPAVSSCQRLVPTVKVTVSLWWPVEGSSKGQAKAPKEAFLSLCSLLARWRGGTRRRTCLQADFGRLLACLLAQPRGANTTGQCSLGAQRPRWRQDWRGY